MLTPPNQDGSPRVIGDIIALDAEQIEVGDRLRPVDQDWAVALGRVMLAEGQRTPIEVAKIRDRKGNVTGWRLVSGGHRHAAAILFPDLNPLRAIEVEDGELSRRQAEIAENLWRRELGPLDRAVFVAEMHEVLLARSGLDPKTSPQEIAAAARWQKHLKDAVKDASDTMSHAYGFTAEIAEQAGLSKRSIERDLMVARRLSGPILGELRKTGLAGNATQLRALARLDRDEQVKVIGRISAGEARSVGEAIAILSNKPKASAEDKRLSAFLGTFARMGLAEKKGALAQLADLLPAGFQLTEAIRRHHPERVEGQAAQ